MISISAGDRRCPLPDERAGRIPVVNRHRMRRWVEWCILLLIGWAFATPALAQSFSGHGSQRTDPFLLEPGVVDFSMDHIGTGPFLVELMDTQGGLVEQVVSAAGSFSGVQAVRIDRGGQYHFRVRATGPWSIQRRQTGEGAVPREEHPTVRGRTSGAAAAPSGWAWRWFSRGLAGGTLLGPLGAGVAVVRAGNSRVEVPGSPAPESPADPRYIAGFREGFEARVRSRRTEAAAVGGMIGSGVFIYVVLQLLDFDLSAERKGREPTPPPPG